MPTAVFSDTKFDFTDWDANSKVKITTPEGSAVAVSALALAQFVAHAYVAPQLVMKLEQQDWRELLLGDGVGKKKR